MSARKVYYSYTVRLKGAYFVNTINSKTERTPWTFSCRAPDADTAKLAAAKYRQDHWTLMGRKPKTLAWLLSRMTAKRGGRY